MKVLIRLNESGDYLHASGAWTSEQDEALAFERGADAVRHCVRNGMRGVHLRYCFSSPIFDFSVSPFGTRRGSSPEVGEPAASIAA